MHLHNTIYCVYLGLTYLLLCGIIYVSVKNRYSVFEQIQLCTCIIKKGGIIITHSDYIKEVKLAIHHLHEAYTWLDKVTEKQKEVKVTEIVRALRDLIQDGV